MGAGSYSRIAYDVDASSRGCTPLLGMNSLVAMPLMHVILLHRLTTMLGSITRR